MGKRAPWLLCSLLATTVLTATPAIAEQRYTYANSYGLPGLIDMPSGAVFSDGDLAFTMFISNIGFRSTLSFQVFEGLTASFRYSGVDLETLAPDRALYFDRSFDVHWQLWEAEGWRPAVAVGIRDIAGTGFYGGEYIVATQNFGENDQVAVTVGLGWGRLAERGGFTNPLGVLDPRFETRPPRNVGEGGTVNADQFFRGDAAVFGGIEWQVNDRLGLALEYSTDPYQDEAAENLIDPATPFNLAARYRFSEYTVGTAYIVQGDTLGVSLNFILNPYRGPVTPGAGDVPPRPVQVRAPQPTPYATDWVDTPGGGAVLRDNFEQLFEGQGLALHHLTLDARRATIRIRNTGYDHEAQALGRVLRAMSAALPPSVEVFEVIFVVEGIDTTRIRVTRSDVEAFEFDPRGAERLLAAAEVEDAVAVADPFGLEVDNPAQRFTWGIGPYLESSLFNPDNPVLFDVGVAFEAEYRFNHGFVAEGIVRVPVVGNLDDAEILNDPPPNPPPVVRSDAALYQASGGPYLQRLTLSHYGRPFENIYSRASTFFMRVAWS